ncbi:MAG: hypothetical protein HC871_13520 [Rhizobiales bacterium]|nr:hypothetical protein [Hyphomicrobiales bacterium]
MTAGILLASVNALRLRISEARFWLLGYAVLAAASLTWTPLPIYSGFWVIRLICVALLLMTYFADADTQDCRRFFTVTLLGTVRYWRCLSSFTSLKEAPRSWDLIVSWADGLTPVWSALQRSPLRRHA